MTIIFPQVPSEARSAVLDTLKKLGNAKSFLTPKLRNADPNLLDLKYGMRAVHLSLDRIAPNGEPKPLHQLVGPPLWRFLVSTGGKAIAAAYAVEGAASDWRLGEIAEGPTVEGAELAVDTVSKKPDLAALRYEPVLLQAPALAVVGLWLRTPRPRDDMVVPIPPSKTPFISFQLMVAKTFVDHLYETAKTIPRHETARGG